jgi:hypothetical protein
LLLALAENSFTDKRRHFLQHVVGPGLGLRVGLQRAEALGLESVLGIRRLAELSHWRHETLL